MEKKHPPFFGDVEEGKMKKAWCTSRYGICKDCGREGSLSQNYLCFDCAYNRVDKSVNDLRYGGGEYYERWKKAVRSAIRKERSDKGKKRK